MLDDEKKNFLFSMMWLYPVLFSINSRLQKCNLFTCTPRMNKSRLSKHTRYGVGNFRGNQLFVGDCSATIKELLHFGLNIETKSFDSRAIDV